MNNFDHIELFLDNNFSVKATRVAYTSAITNFRDFIGKSYPLAMDLALYQEHLSAKGYAASTINSSVSSVKTYFKWLRDNKLLEDEFGNEAENRVANVACIKPKEPVKADAFNDKQLETFFGELKTNKSIQGNRDFIYFSLVLCTGMKPSEVLRLRIMDIIECDSFNSAPKITIRGRGGIVSRVVFIPGDLHGIIKNYLSLLDIDKTPKTYLFQSFSNRSKGSNRHITLQAINRVFLSVLDATKLRKNRFTIESLRHTFAQKLLEGGRGLYEISEIANISMGLLKKRFRGQGESVRSVSPGELAVFSNGDNLRLIS